MAIVANGGMVTNCIIRNNKINTAYYCSVLLQLVTDVLPNSILVIERNSYGGLAVTKLL